MPVVIEGVVYLAVHPPEMGPVLQPQPFVPEVGVSRFVDQCLDGLMSRSVLPRA